MRGSFVNSKEKSILSNKVVATLAAILCTFLWGSAYPAVKLGYELFNVGADDTAAKLAFAGVRFFLSGLIVLIFFRAQNKTKVLTISFNKNFWQKVVILALVQTTIHYYFYYIGLSYTTGAKASILNTLAVFFSALLAHMFYKDDRLNLAKSIGILVGLFAVVIVNYESKMGLTINIRGEGYILIASLFTALASLYTKKASESVDPVLLSGSQLTVGGALLLVIGLLMGSTFPISNPKGLLLLLYMASLSSVAFSLWAALLKHNKVSSITIFFFLVPVFGTLLSVLVLKESVMKIQYLIALPAVAIGIYLVNK